jgi:hypothetical protein
MIVCYPPNLPFINVWDHPTVFLAGSIEMNKAEDWQKEFVECFANTQAVLFNPRRPDWDNTITQTKDDPRFREQVEWELQMLESVDVVAMYLQPHTNSPISLLELGLCRSKKMVVCCPPMFHRKGNVDIVCERYNIPQVDTIKQLATETKKLLRIV